MQATSYHVQLVADQLVPNTYQLVPTYLPNLPTNSLASKLTLG